MRRRKGHNPSNFPGWRVDEPAPVLESRPRLATDRALVQARLVKSVKLAMKVPHREPYKTQSPYTRYQLGPMLAENHHVCRDARHILLQRRITRCSSSCPPREALPQSGFHPSGVAGEYGQYSPEESPSNVNTTTPGTATAVPNPTPIH